MRPAQCASVCGKESTISSLKDRVTKLEVTVEEMNRILLAFHDYAIESSTPSVKPNLALN